MPSSPNYERLRGLAALASVETTDPTTLAEIQSTLTDLREAISHANAQFSQLTPKLKVLFTTFFSAGRAGPRAPARRPCRDPWHTVQELELSGNPTESRHGSSAGSGPGSTSGGEDGTETEKQPPRVRE